MDRIFLACTPRTGNLWLRRIVAGALNMPAVAVHNPAEVDWPALPERCLVAVHWPHSTEFDAFLRQQGFRVMVTARHPLDVLVSILNFAAVEPLTSRWLEGEGGNERALMGASPDDQAFADYCLSPRADALLGVSTDWAATADATVRYEDALASPAEAIARLLDALGLSAQADLDGAADANNLDRMRTLAPQHVWRGKAGDWRRVVTASLAAKVHERHRRHFDAFGYQCEADATLDAAQARRNWVRMTQDDVTSLSPAPPRP